MVARVDKSLSGPLLRDFLSSAADDKWLLVGSFVVVLLIFMTLVDIGKLIIESI